MPKSNSNFLIYSSVTDWVVLAADGRQVAVSADQDFNSKLREIKELVAGESQQQNDIVVLLKSDECLCVDLQKPNSKSTEQFLFDLEEHLPLDAEQMVLANRTIPCRFESVVDRRNLDQLVSGLDSIGVTVKKIVSATLFLLQQAKVDTRQSTFVLELFDGVDLISFDEKGISSWTWFNKGSFSWEQVEQQHQTHDGSSRNRVVSNIDGESNDTTLKVESIHLTADSVAGLASKPVLRSPWLSFPIEANQLETINYGKASFVTFAVTLMVMAAVVNLGLWIAGSRCHAEGTANIERQQSILKAISPGARRRANVEAYLKSYLARQEKNQAVVSVVDATGNLTDVADVVRYLDSQQEIRVARIGYSPGQVSLEGSAPSDRVLADLANEFESKGFAVVKKQSPPSSDDQRKSFAWSISVGDKS